MALKDLRERYLAQAAASLRVSDPSTAAALAMDLLSMGDATQRAKELPNPCIGCPACGSIDGKMRTIWPTQRSPLRTPGRHKSFNSPQARLRLLVYSCNTCGRDFKQHLKASVKSRAPLMPVEQAAIERKSDALSTSTTIEPKTAVTSGKKRAKTRKEGLQALLDKSKQDAQPVSGFTLMDFMRK